MNAVRTSLIGCLIGIGLALGALAPASAADTSRPIADNASVVSNEPWSTPAYPVDCLQSGAQISCTPMDATDVRPQQCFVNVYAGGTRATVCTTFEDHIPAIKTSGGMPLLVEYGCSLGDVVCVTFENAGRGLAITATSTMFAIAQAMRFDTSTTLWTAAAGEWSFWQWAILGILFCAMVWAVAAAIVSGDRAELVGALVRSFIAFPASAIALWLTGHLLNAIDDLTWYVLNRSGPDGLFSTLQSVMWAGGRANYFFAFVLHAILMIGMLLMLLVFAFRNIVLAALIAVGPIAWMLFPVRGLGPQWVVRYVSAVVVLLLTGPLTIGFLTLVINGLANVSTIWDPQAWPLIVGLLLVAFAPFAVFGLFSFVGAVAADSVGSRLGAGAGRGVSRAAGAVSRVPSRISALPAGGATKAGAVASGASRASVSGGSSAKGPVGPSSAGGQKSSAPTPSTSSRAATATASRPPTAAGSTGSAPKATPHTSSQRANARPTTSPPSSRTERTSP